MELAPSSLGTPRYCWHWFVCDGRVSRRAKGEGGGERSTWTKHDTHWGSG